MTKQIKEIGAKEYWEIWEKIDQGKEMTMMESILDFADSFHKYKAENLPIHNVSKSYDAVGLLRSIIRDLKKSHNNEIMGKNMEIAFKNHRIKKLEMRLSINGINTKRVG